MITLKWPQSTALQCSNNGMVIVNVMCRFLRKHMSLKVKTNWLNSSEYLPLNTIACIYCIVSLRVINNTFYEKGMM